LSPFNSLYSSGPAASAYDELREVVAQRYFDGARDFNAATIIRMARGLYEDESTFTQGPV